jgi:CHAD domain-containing protein
MAEELERARKALRELSKTLKSLSTDPPPNEVHKLRTTTRRVEAIVSVLSQLEGKESRRLLKSIEPVRKAAGGVREMDVLIVNARKLARQSTGDSLTRLPGDSVGRLRDDSVARLVEQLQIARQHNAVELRRAIGRRRDSARENLKQYIRLVRAESVRAKRSASANGSAANDGIHAAAINVHRELGEWLPLNAENIHAFRLKVKALRYILQLSADANPRLGDALGNVQRRVGDWHDWHQLQEIAREILNQKRDGVLLARINQTTAQRFSQALAAANALRGKYLNMPVAHGV